MTKKTKAALVLAAQNAPQPPDESLQPPKESKQKKITQKGLDKYHREKYLENIASILEAAYPMLVKKIQDGDVKALQMAFEISNLLKAQGSVSVINQIYSKTQVNNIAASGNGNSDAPGGIQSFESILRRLETTDRVIDVTAQ